MKVVVWWGFIYPVAAHRPCGHVCAQKNKSGTISWQLPTITSTTSTMLHSHSVCTNDHEHNTGTVCFFYQSIITYTKCFSFFLLGSILLLLTHEWCQQEWCQHQQRWHTTPTPPLTPMPPSTKPHHHHKQTNTKHPNDNWCHLGARYVFNYWTLFFLPTNLIFFQVE